MPYFYFDWTYIVIVLPMVLFALLAQAGVSSTFKKYSKVATRRGISGAQSAQSVLDRAGVRDVKIERVAGKLTDHFDPRTKVIRLSDSVYDNTSAAAVGVAAHEAGHAVQYAVGYTPMKIRGAIIPMTNIGSNLAVPLVILGIIFSNTLLAYIGVAAFGLAVLFQLITLPVEFNASARALSYMSESNMYDDDELSASKKVLRAAALTYVAALAVALANLLRLFIIAGQSKRR